jgi:tRNA modification GTPase
VIGSNDTIFALSSGALPAAIAVVRISGAAAGTTLEALIGRRVVPRRASYAALRDPKDGELIDRALVLWFPGPSTATGEDLAEIHCHGSRAVVAALVGWLAREPGLRLAKGGEFTRRACLNGRMTLAEAEALGELLVAETERERKAALGASEGALSTRIRNWQDRLGEAAAAIEAVLDFAEEDQVGDSVGDAARAAIAAVRDEIAATLAQPAAERLRDGIRVVLCGPPNSGKSSLFNALTMTEGAIVSPRPGTTRDVIEMPLAIDGVPFLLVDTAGLHETEDDVEAIGIARARSAAERADLRLWLGEGAEAGGADVLVDAMCDRPLPRPLAGKACIATSARTGQGIDELRALLVTRAAALVPHEDRLAVNARQREALAEAASRLESTGGDLVCLVEAAVAASIALGAIDGDVRDDVLDRIFARFCIGK